MRFFVGIHHPNDARHVPAAFISVNTLRGRKSDFVVNDWIMDSGAFSTIAKHGGYPRDVADYARQIHRWKSCGNLLAAVTEDYMCEPQMLQRTGLTVQQHQQLTIDRYDQLITLVPDVCILPVLQGYQPQEYVDHLRMYGSRLAYGAWVGVGSVCKRNVNPAAIATVLDTILAERPDLRLHGFGIKKTALLSPAVRAALISSDSMAWSFAARYEGRDGNDWREAVGFAAEIQGICRVDAEVAYMAALATGDPFADFRWLTWCRQGYWWPQGR